MLVDMEGLACKVEPLNDLGIDGNVVLNWIWRKHVGWEDVDWIYVSQVRDQWRAVVGI
jgi:hypothetical protein